MKRWRHLYPYICTCCGKRRYALVFARSVEGLCRIGRKNAVPKDQTALL
jgi:hypothetical protein